MDADYQSTAYIVKSKTAISFITAFQLLEIH